MRSSIDYKGNNSCFFCSIPRGLTPADMARHQKMPFLCLMFFLRSRRSRFFSLFQIFEYLERFNNSKKFEVFNER